MAPDRAARTVGPTRRYRWRVAALFADVSPLRHSRHFRRLWTGQTVSAMGSQLTLVAVAYQAFHLTHSTLMVGMIGFTQLVPLLAGALWGGTLADAWDRRRVLTLTQVAMALAVAGWPSTPPSTTPGVGPLRLHGGRRRVPGDGLAGPAGRAAPAGGRGRRDRGGGAADHHHGPGHGGGPGRRRRADRPARAERAST